MFLASLGLEVLGVDGSAVGLAKARRLAEAKGVSIDTLVVDLADYEPPAAAFGAVVSIFAHLPSRVRGRLNRLLERSLRRGLCLAYRPEQLGRGTGGPADVDMLVSDTLVVDLADYEPPAAAFGAVVSIFAHLPSRVRGRLNRLLERSLRPGGLFLLEAYRPEQLGRGTGGPADVDMLVSRAALEAELPDCEVLAREIEREVVEGRFHTGAACVVQFIARKR